MRKWTKPLVLITLITSAVWPVTTSTWAVVKSRTDPPTKENSAPLSMLREGSSDTNDSEAPLISSSSSFPSAFDSSYQDSEDEDGSSSFVAGKLEIGAHVKTIDKVQSTYRNWVGPTIGKPDRGDSACYRKAYIMETCPVGFNHKWKTCWTQCPLSYPLQCGWECIRQNDDCALEVYVKTANVLQSAISLATMGLFGELTAATKGIVSGAKCIRSIIGTVKMLVKYIRSIKVSDPQSSYDKIMSVLYQTSYVTIDFPVTIAMCLGLPYPEILDPGSWMLDTIQLLLGEVLDHGDNIVRGWDQFKAFLHRANFTQPLSELNETEISSLKTGLASKSTCGYELKQLTDRTWMTVAQMKKDNPSVTQDELRVAIYESDLMVRDIPTVTNNCMDQMIAESTEATAYQTRDTLRKTLGVIVDDLVDKGRSDNGTSLTAKEYTRVVTDKVAMTIFVLFIDMTRIVGIATEYIQPICGPTQFIGEIDDGTVPYTLGLNTVGKAFKGSKLAWRRKGDGVVTIAFKSEDTKAVTVNIFSGGDKIGEKDVPAGGNATWASNITALGGKSLYLDRWRPGFLGLPGTGGGSLKLWVPKASQGGHLDLSVKLNVS